MAKMTKIRKILLAAAPQGGRSAAGRERSRSLFRIFRRRREKIFQYSSRTKRNPPIRRRVQESAPRTTADLGQSPYNQHEVIIMQQPEVYRNDAL